ncbi:MAG: TM7S3/TM198-like domain-containing protein [Thermomicrobiales bacterium]|jgi:hypothetical protein
MSIADFFWGLLVICSGVFIGVYGSMLFRFALAAMGFGLGFLGTLTVLSNQGTSTRVLIALAVGGVAAVALYSLVKFGIYIAGAIFGLVLSFVVSSLLSIVSAQPGHWLVTVLALVGAGAGGFLAPRFASLAIILATSAASAYLIVNGIQVWYANDLDVHYANPGTALSNRLSLIVFLIVFAMAFLSQFAMRTLRSRVPVR